MASSEGQTRKRSASSMGYEASLSSVEGINVNGLAFVAQLTKKGQLVLPSTKNYFGTFKVSNLMVDDGCSSMLIVLEDVHRIDDIFQAFPPATHTYYSSQGYGTGGESVAFEVSPIKSSVLIPLHLCRDLLPTVPSLSVDRVRFALNTQAEIMYMLDNHGEKLNPPLKKFLKHEVKLPRPSKTLPFSLLGFKVVEKVGVVRKRAIQYYYNPDQCTLIDFSAVDKQDVLVRQHLAFKTSPARRLEIEAEVAAELAAKGGDYADTDMVVLWEEELPYHGKEREAAEIKDDEEEGTESLKQIRCCADDIC